MLSFGWISVLFKKRNPPVAKCLVHCYQPQMKEKAKKIMRYSGPRMLFHSPVLTLRHVFDGRKKPQTIGEFKKRKH
jgi:hypothetical protein